MYYIDETPNAAGCYGGLTTAQGEGKLFLPDHLYGAFLACKGFAALKTVGRMITALTPKEEALAAYLAAHPEPAAKPDPIAAVQAQLAAQDGRIEALESAGPGDLPARVQTLEDSSAVQGDMLLSERAQLEAQAARLAAVEGSGATVQTALDAQAAQLTAADARLTALESAPGADLGDLPERVAALESAGTGGGSGEVWDALAAAYQEGVNEA